MHIEGNIVPAEKFVSGCIVKPKNGEAVIGTYSYGLEAVGEMHKRTLIRPQVITKAILPPQA